MTNSIYDIVTDKILAALDEGTVPWKQTWEVGEPRNAVTNRRYSGGNWFLLYLTANSKGYETNQWLTYKQASQFGGTVTKGEHGTQIIYMSRYQKRTGPSKDDVETRGVMRYYYVFNIAQTEGVKLPVHRAGPSKQDAVVSANTIYADKREAMAIAEMYEWQLAGGVHHGDYHPPHYLPSQDRINMPTYASFQGNDAYYATLFHELAHSTGHESRLNRELVQLAIDPHARGREELIAEFTAAFLCAATGIESQLDSNASYIAGWRDTIAADTRLVVQAASAAQRAANLILDADSATDVESEDGDMVQ